MTIPYIALVLAYDSHRLLGIDGKLPWRSPADMKHFREITLGHNVVMGRKTYHSLACPLPLRTNIVLTRDPNFRTCQGVQVFHDPQEVLAYHLANPTGGPLMVIGGAQIYTIFYALAARAFVTEVRSPVDFKLPSEDRLTRLPPHMHFVAPLWEAKSIEYRSADELNPFLAFYDFVWGEPQCYIPPEQEIACDLSLKRRISAQLRAQGMFHAPNRGQTE